MSNLLGFESKEGNMIKLSVSQNPLNELEKNVSAAYEMAKRGSINSAIDAIETAQQKYTEKQPELSVEHIIVFQHAMIM